MRRLALFTAALLLAACGHEDEHLSGASRVEPPGRPSAPPEAAPVNPHAGDPHMGGMPAPVAPSPAPVAWTVPADWKSTPPSSGMRLAQFEIGTDDAGGTVQCVVYSGNMGADEDNISRWVGQMGPAAKDGAKIVHSEHDGLKVTRLEAHGPFTDTMRPGATPIASATMLAAIVDAPSGKLYVKLAGPKAIVDAAAPKFDAFLASLKPK